MRIEIRLAGAAAPELTGLAEELLREVGNAEPERRKAGPSEAPIRSDPVAIAALILSVPGAAVAVVDLAQRARLAERVQKLLERARASDGAATLQVGAEPPLDLATATEDQVMDLIARSRGRWV
jgi:hypothetical protein